MRKQGNLQFSAICMELENGQGESESRRGTAKALVHARDIGTPGMVTGTEQKRLQVGGRERLWDAGRLPTRTALDTAAPPLQSVPKAIGN